MSRRWRVNLVSRFVLPAFIAGAPRGIRARKACHAAPRCRSSPYPSPALLRSGICLPRLCGRLKIGCSRSLCGAAIVSFVKAKTRMRSMSLSRAGLRSRSMAMTSRSRKSRAARRSARLHFSRAARAPQPSVRSATASSSDYPATISIRYPRQRLRYGPPSRRRSQNVWQPKRAAAQIFIAMGAFQQRVHDRERFLSSVSVTSTFPRCF